MSKPGLGHTLDCPRFDTHFPWECDCRSEAPCTPAKPSMAGDTEARAQDLVRAAMREGWDEICSDTGCHPLDIRRGKGRELWFEPSHWADYVAMILAPRFAASEQIGLAPARGGSEPDRGSDIAGRVQPSEHPASAALPVDHRAEPVQHPAPVGPGDWANRCTDCDDTGITIQTERRCACQPALSTPSVPIAGERETLERAAKAVHEAFSRADINAYLAAPSDIATTLARAVIRALTGSEPSADAIAGDHP